MPTSCLCSCRFPTTESRLAAESTPSIFLNAGIGRRKSHALRRDRIRDELFRRLIVSRHANSVVHRSGRLQFLDQLEEAVAVVFLRVTQTVEPDQSDRASRRSEERRVGKEGRSRGAAYHEKKKKRRVRE